MQDQGSYSSILILSTCALTHLNWSAGGPIFILRTLLICAKV